MDICEKLEAQANGLALMAEEAQAVSDHFRPRFEACWKDGKLVDGPTALRLQAYVLDRRREAERFRSEENELLAAIAALRHTKDGEG